MLSSKHIYELILGTIIALGILGTILIFIAPIYWSVLFDRKRHERRRGPSRSTLVLYVLLANLIFWGGCIYPQMLHYAGHDPRAEARNNLGSLYFSQLGYYSDHHTYAGRSGGNGTGCFSDLMNWHPDGMRWNDNLTQYNYFCGHDVIIASKPGVAIPPYRPDSTWPDGVPKPENSETGFTMVAIGNVDFDEGIDVWTINDSKELKNLINDIPNENDQNATVLNILQNKYFTSMGEGIPWVINLVLTPFVIVSMLFDRKRKIKESRNE
jgi:hypothetical protein